MTNYSSVYSINLFYLSIYLTNLLVVGVFHQRVTSLAEGYSKLRRSILCGSIFASVEAIEQQF